jgi:hypothetical protein
MVSTVIGFFFKKS